MIIRQNSTPGVDCNWPVCPERAEELLAILGLDLIQEAARRFRQPT